MDFRDRLLLAMDERGIIQADLAKRSGIARGSICQYMKGGFTPKLDNARKIAQALNVNPDWLLTGKGNMEFTEEEKMYNRMAEVEGRFNDLRILAESLSEEQLKELIRYGEYIKNK